jgi:hypothetical protein
MKQMALPPSFCLRHGVVILDQYGSGISFGIVDIDDKALCRRLEKSFYRFGRRTGNDASGSVVHFIKIDKAMCARYVEKLFADEGEIGGSGE